MTSFRVFFGDLLPAEPLSLPTAYWLYGVAGNIAIGIFTALVWGQDLPHGVAAVWIGYSAWNLVLIWDAATHYRGLVLWAGLAKVFVIINTAVLAAVAFLLISLKIGGGLPK